MTKRSLPFGILLLLLCGCTSLQEIAGAHGSAGAGAYGGIPDPAAEPSGPLPDSPYGDAAEDPWADTEPAAEPAPEAVQGADHVVVFDEPRIDGYRVDVCLHFGQQCGKPAADAWCRMQGYAEASTWVTGGKGMHTKILGSGQICDQFYCDGFTSIHCH